MQRFTFIRTYRFFFCITLLILSPQVLWAKPIESLSSMDLYAETGIFKGVCSILGADNIAAGLEIARTGDYYVHVIDPDPAAVQKAQERADVDGLYGKSILVENNSFSRLPYVDNLVDVLIIPHANKENLDSFSVQECMRVLRPGGWMLVGNPDAKADLSRRDLQRFCSGSKVQQKKIKKQKRGLWLLASKPPLEGIDEWPMWEHGPDNNPVSKDQVIKAPFMTQWLGLPFYNTMPMITLASGGRVFLAMGHIAHHVREEPWLNTLLARNGYNGTILWTLKLPDGYMTHRSAYVATPDTFYMIDLDGVGCLMLDPETGDEKGEINLPGIRGEWKWMTMVDGVLYGLVGEKRDPPETTVVRSNNPHWSWGELSPGYYDERVPWGFGETLFAYDLRRGKVRWIHTEEKPVDSRAMTMGGGHLYIYGPDSHVRCLDAKSGKVVWTNDDGHVRELIEEKGRGLVSTPGFRSMCYSLYTPKALFFEAQTRMNIVAVSLEDGRYLWHRKKSSYNPNMLYTEGNIFVGIGPEGSTLELNPLTGETLRDLGFKKRSCARLTATPDSFFCRGWREGLTRYDRQTGAIQFNGAFRPSCNDGIVPAHGLLYTGPWPCDCNLSVMGHISLSSAGDFSFENHVNQPGRLEYGPKRSSNSRSIKVDALDWSTYRGNNDHGSYAPLSLSQRIMKIWDYQPESPFQPTAPTSAGGLIYVGGDDGKVRAIDAAQGKIRWTYRTQAPILQPPTLWEGRAYVGSGDGWIYALDATTGELVWRFRAAPVERKTMVYGALCSTWPVHSGILVHEGVVYAAAGVIDYDGTYVYALDADTGRVIWHNSTSGHLDKTLRKGVSAQGTLTVFKNRLWMAGGNVISPAVYDLENGKYVGAELADGSPQSNRGEEIGVIGGTILLGGKLRFTTGENFVNPGRFDALSLDADSNPAQLTVLNEGKIPPAWDDKVMVYVNGRKTVPKCSTIESALTQRKERRRSAIARNVWQADSLSGSDTVSLALTDNVVLAVSEVPRQRWLETRWRLQVLHREDGTPMGHYDLSAPAMTSGLLVDRAGRILVVEEGGKLECFGGPDALKKYVSFLLDLPGGQDATPIVKKKF